MGGPPFPTIADSAESQAFVDARVAEGSDFIKIIYDDLKSLGMSVPMLDRRTLRGLVAAAHARGKLAVVHVLTEAQATDAIEAGVDGLVHLFTASGVVLAFLALEATWSGEFRLALLWLLAALAVDGVDGTLARWARVKEHVPRIDGEAFDLIVDYLNYVFVPAIFIAASALVVASAVLGNPVNAAVGTGLLLLGIPVYLWWRRPHWTRRAAAPTTSQRGE